MVQTNAGLCGAAKRVAYYVDTVRSGGRDPAGTPDAPAETIMKRVPVVLLLVLLSGVARGEFNVVEASITDMQRAIANGNVTSRELVQQYLTRIALYDKKLNAVMTVNQNALREAEERDRERAQGRLRGPLHGIPIALKDNIHTTDMPTTGGALAFQGFVPPYEATVVKSLRDAGAVIIAKTGMTELANWMAGP